MVKHTGIVKGKCKLQVAKCILIGIFIIFLGAGVLICQSGNESNLLQQTTTTESKSNDTQSLQKEQSNAEKAQILEEIGLLKGELRDILNEAETIRKQIVSKMFGEQARKLIVDKIKDFIAPAKELLTQYQEKEKVVCVTPAVIEESYARILEEERREKYEEEKIKIDEQKKKEEKGKKEATGTTNTKLKPFDHQDSCRIIPMSPAANSRQVIASKGYIQYSLVIIFCFLFSSIYCVSKQVPNYVKQANEGKLFSEEDLANEDFKFNFKIEGADRFTIKKLLTRQECFEGDVIKLLLGSDPFMGIVGEIIKDPKRIEKVKNIFRLAIDCAKEYLEKIKQEKENTSSGTPEATQVQNDYDDFHKINDDLYVCTNRMLRCSACRQDCERYKVSEKGVLSKNWLEFSIKCYSHCLSSINILPPPRQSQFCERCLDSFYVTDRELCNEECDYNPFSKCVAIAGEMQKCIKDCKGKFDRETALPDLEDCFNKCNTDLSKKYGKVIAAKGDNGLSFCFQLPMIFENIAIGKKVDFIAILGICPTDPNIPGRSVQTQGPCGSWTAAAQPAQTNPSGGTVGSGTVGSGSAVPTPPSASATPSPTVPSSP